MQNTPKSLRLQIAILGRVNSGKSSFLNLITGQQTSIASEVAGTTTDVVEKAMELPPLGAVLWLDTAGFGDSTELQNKRTEKTSAALQRADMALLICEGDNIGEIERDIIKEVEEAKVPLIKIYNKSDKFNIKSTDGLKVNSLDLNTRHEVLSALTELLISNCPPDFLSEKPLISDLAEKNSTVIMIVPIDYEAPRGRLILPQVQAIRDCLDGDQNIIVCKENNYTSVLQNLKNPPALVVCDSQVVDLMVAQTPTEIKCTTFSILMARFKADLTIMAKNAAIIKNLKDGDKVLIAESCTHHAVEDDIGRVKIPALLRKKTQKNLIIDFVSGCDFAKNLEQYKLVIQCGGCTINRKEMISRLQKCDIAGVKITNYGVAISELKGVLERVLEPFPEAYQAYLSAKESFSD